MTNILGQIAWDGDSIPHHMQRTDHSTGRLPIASLNGPITHHGERGAIALRGHPRLHDATDARAVAREVLDRYLDDDLAMLEELRGPFALVLFDASGGKCLAAIDRMGVERLAWGRVDGWVAVGTSAVDAGQSISRSPKLNRQALFKFMYSHMVPAPDTVFADVKKLLPGTAIEFSESGQREYRYWQPDFERGTRVDIDRLRDDTRPTLSRAIERAAPGEYSGAFLSGGLDSSTVTGLLAEIQGGQTTAFSVGFGVDEYDEMEFARAAATKFNCAHHIYEVKPSDIVNVIPKIAAAYDEPFGNSSAVPTFCCARLAKEHGVDHLLAGDGGDELFGGNERYVRHRIFELYSRLPAWLRKRLIEPIAYRIDPESGVFPFRKISSYVRQARIPLPERFESWNLIYREGAERIFTPEFLESVDPECLLTQMRDVWQSCPSDDILDRMLWYDWKFTLADNDIRKVSRMCELAGVRVSYPMLDEEFVELSMSVPSNVKIQGYELRTFFKSAVKGFVPDKIITKEKHGFGLPFGVWLKADSALQELVYGSVESLRQRGIFEPDFLGRVIAEHRDGHASYFGYAIWDLVMLEQWMQHHVAQI